MSMHPITSTFRGLSFTPCVLTLSCIALLQAILTKTYICTTRMSVCIADKPEITLTQELSCGQSLDNFHSRLSSTENHECN